MDDELRPDIDRRLREAFEPGPGAVNRVREGAAARSRRVSASRRVALAASVAAICVAAALALWRPPRVAAPGPPELLAGSLSDGVISVPLPDGSTFITGGQARLNRPSDGYGIVLVEGELR